MGNAFHSLASRYQINFWQYWTPFETGIDHLDWPALWDSLMEWLLNTFMLTPSDMQREKAICLLKCPQQFALGFDILAAEKESITLRVLSPRYSMLLTNVNVISIIKQSYYSVISELEAKYFRRTMQRLKKSLFITSQHFSSLLGKIKTINGHLFI